MVKHIPRQRKHRVLARERAAQPAAPVDAPEDNAEIILPQDKAARDEKKAQLRKQLGAEGVKVSGKKAKRLEKYIETKLRKDETKVLLEKLAQNKIDTSLFSSTRTLGQGKETKKQALTRSLREQRAGIDVDQDHAQVLFEERQARDDEDDDEEARNIVPKLSEVVEPVVTKSSNKAAAAAKKASRDESDDDEESTATPPATTPAVAHAPVLPSSGLGLGSGLKRPLETDDDGRPIIQKRQKRGGVKSKVSLATLGRPYKTLQETKSKDESEDEDEWGGFSSEDDDDDDDDEEEEEEEEINSSADEEDDEEEESGEDQTDSDNGSQDSSEEEEDDDEDEDMEDAESEGDEGKKSQRSSAFKAWAQQQRNEALGYQPQVQTTLNLPKPKNFTPRAIEEDELPFELQPTTNTDRKVFSVSVDRSEEIKDARLKLPIIAEEQRLMEAIHNHDTVVICGATGSGKTTQLPQFLYESGYGSPDSPTPGLIGVTQPRRVAAVSMSRRVAEELGDHSHVVAYQIRFEGTVDPNTAIKFMTDGVLLREVAQDITLKKYSAIVIDEAHERSVNTDILIGMLSRVIKLRRELSQTDPSIKPLKLIIMSATLRVEDMTQNPTLFATPPPILEVEGRQHPVTMHFSRVTNPDYVQEAFKKICKGHRKLPPGGFLVFLTGQGEIAQLSKKLKAAFGGPQTAAATKVRIPASEAPMEVEDIEFGGDDDDGHDDFDDGDGLVGDDDENEDDDAEFDLPEEEGEAVSLKMQVLPLYSLLPTRDQMRVFEQPPEGTRQVILATNVAETSLTIPGTRFVFDSGRAKERRYDPVSGVQSYEIGWISQASANQRSGRAGRTGPGHCYRMYSSAVFERDFAPFTDPELLRMPIEGVVLQLKAMNLQHVVNFPFPSPPDRRSIAKAERLLAYLSAISGPAGQVTKVGQTMSIFPLSPRFSRILLVGHLHDCLPYTIALVAALSAPEVFIPENQAIPALANDDDDDDSDNGDDNDDKKTRATKKPALRTNADVLAETRQANVRRMFNEVHRNFCFLDERADAIKLLQVVGEFAHEPTEEWCAAHFTRFKVLRETQQLRRQLAELLAANIPAFRGLRHVDKLPPPSAKQVAALKQMVAAGFVDQVAIRADLAPIPPTDPLGPGGVPRKPRRAIDVGYVPLLASAMATSAADDPRVYIHPASPLAHRSPAECPEYVVYAHLQRGTADPTTGKTPKTRMHALTDVSGGQLAALAKGTPLLTYGKPVKEVLLTEGAAPVRECWVVPYLRAENSLGQGWPLPMRKIKQRKVPGKGWVTE